MNGGEPNSETCFDNDYYVLVKDTITRYSSDAD